MNLLVIFFIFGLLPFLTLGNDIIEEALLDEIERASFLFFWEQADPETGQVKDRSYLDGRLDTRDVSSIAATGDQFRFFSFR